jgi:hypothetical protein
VMLSGYYQGGLLGLPLAGAIAGATLASYAARPQPNASPYLGVGIVGTFSVLLIGHFFGALPSSSAIGLLLAPLLAWIPELVGARKLGPRARAVARLVMVAVPLILIVTRAQMKFTEASATSSKPHEAPHQDRNVLEK